MREARLLRPRAPLQWRWWGHSGEAGRAEPPPSAVLSGASPGAVRGAEPGAVRGAEAGQHLALSAVLNRAAPGSPPAREREVRLPCQFAPSAGLLYWPSPPAHPSRSTKKKKRTKHNNKQPTTTRRELERCATSTRSESTCGRRSFSSGKVRLFGMSG